MNPTEFYLWLNGYLEALESEGIEKIKIKNIREKMVDIKIRPNQERVVFGPNVTPQQTNYANRPQTPPPPSGTRLS
tara:strand:- start:154 stop:381 length:228 start_codon:yes stop_codon:yes gene_type:complete